MTFRHYTAELGKCKEILKFCCFLMTVMLKLWEKGFIMPQENQDAILEERDLEQEVVDKIAEAHNILVALSGDPSMDEMAAAIGLTIYLDKIGKKATAIYSGATPSALAFLNPEETFDTTADVLQDFVIALNKEKADHLRYKVDGDYVKIFITPMKERVAEEDLEFYYGDYNVDLVIALDVLNGVDLDAALREHGRIMHDAAVVNITTGNPGKFGEVEWSDKKASSVSEMLAGLIYKINHKMKMEKAEATAFLAGIVAATNRFANGRTTAATMKMASRLIESGANQQLVAKNIDSDVDNELYSLNFSEGGKKKDAETLEVAEGDENAEVNAVVNEERSSLLEDLKAAEASLAGAAAEVVTEEKKEDLKIEDGVEVKEPVVENVAPVVEPVVPVEPVETVESAAETVAKTETNEPETPFLGSAGGEKVIPVPESATADGSLETDSERYGRMLREALAGENPAVMAAPEPVQTTVEAPVEMNFGAVPEDSFNNMPMPEVATAGTENVVEAKEAEILPPPPALEVPEGPAMPDGTTFQIPGM